MTNTFSRLGVVAVAAIMAATTLPLPSVANTYSATASSDSTQPAAPDVPDLADGLIIRFATRKSDPNLPVGGSESKSQAAKTSQRIQQATALSAAGGATLQYAHDVSADSQLYWLPDIVPASQAQAVASRLQAQSKALGIESVEIDYRMFPLRTPNDPRYADQWHYQTASPSNYGMNLPATWDVVTGSANIVVAVIDTGILFTHPDLAGRTVPGYDFISRPEAANDGDGRDANAADPGDWITSAENASGFFQGCGTSDSSWHGSHVAGTIGANSNNGVGVAGVNWNSKILPIRTLGKCGGSLSDIAAGIRWAAGIHVDGVPDNPTPARVINMSLGGNGTCSGVYQSAINDAVARGVVVVVAAGNENSNASGSQPANCDNVVAVGSTRRNGLRASYSNFGADVDLSAPGGSTNPNEEGGILSTIDSGLTSPEGPIYAYYQGTSMATPNVAGVVSLMLSVQPLLQPAQVEAILKASVTAFPAASDCDTKGCGTGILDALKAVSAAGDLQISRTFMPALQAEVPVIVDPGTALTNGNFEAGRTAWTEVSADPGIHIIYSIPELQAESNSIVPQGGQYLAWLGGLNNENARLSQNVIVPANATRLKFWHRVSSSDMCGWDSAFITLGGASIYNLDLCTDTVITSWQQVSIDISSYAGQTLALQFQVTTDESNQSSWYVDTITIE